MSYEPIAFVANASNFARNATEAYSLGEAYPVTRNGWTFGWVFTDGSPSAGPTMADFTGTGYPKTAPGPDLYSGRAAVSSGVKVFRLDLKYGPGTYRIKGSLGNKNGSALGSILCAESPDGSNEIFHLLSTAPIPAGGQMGYGGIMYSAPDVWWAAVDQDNVSGGGQYVEFTTQQDHIFFTLFTGAAANMNCMLLEFQGLTPPTPSTSLVSVTVNPATVNLSNVVAGDKVGDILNADPYSTLTLSNNAGGMFDVDDASRTIIVGSAQLTQGQKTITIVETLAGATNSPRSTTLTIDVTATSTGGGTGSGAALQDVSVKVDAAYGAQLTPADVTTVYAGQPAGEIFGLISAPAGAALLGNFAITGGSLAPYLTLASVAAPNGSGTVVALVHNSTRIPDNLATYTLSIRQTDAAAPNTPHTTNLTFSTFISSNGRPTTGDFGDMPTPMWLWLKRNHDMVMNNYWKGYDVAIHGAIAGGKTQTVHNTTELNAALQSFVSSPPDGSSWYAIKFAAPTGAGYTGTFADVPAINFGAGGLVFQRNGSDDPELNFSGRFFGINLDLGDLRWPGRTATTGAQNKAQITFMDPNASNTAIWSKIAHSARVGWLHADAAIADLAAAEQAVVSDAGSYLYNSFMFIYGAESLYERDADYRGTQNHTKVYNTRYALRRFQATKYNQDIGAMAQVFGLASKKGVFADDDCYVWYEPVVHNGLDFTGLASTAHCDITQIRTYDSGTSPPRFPGCGWANNASKFSPFNTTNHNRMCSQYNGTVWQVVSVGATGLVGGTATAPAIPVEMTADPTGLAIGTQVQDGDVLFKYIGRMPGWNCKLNIVVANCATHSASYQTNSAPASVQQFINSNAGYGYPTEVMLLNMGECSPNSRGVGNDAWRVVGLPSGNFVESANLPRNKVYGWRSAFLGPAQTNKRVDPTKFWSTANAVDVVFRKCIVPTIDSPSNYSTLNQRDNLVINYRANGGNPGAYLRGGSIFQWISKSSQINYWGFPAFVDNGYNKNQFLSDFSKIIHHNTGAYGPRLREEYTITIGAETHILVINPPQIP